MPQPSNVSNLPEVAQQTLNKTLPADGEYQQEEALLRLRRLTHRHRRTIDADGAVWA